VVFVTFLITVVMPSTFMNEFYPSKLIQHGDSVDPGWGRNVVYVESDHATSR